MTIFYFLKYIITVPVFYFYQLMCISTGRQAFSGHLTEDCFRAHLLETLFVYGWNYISECFTELQLWGLFIRRTRQAHQSGLRGCDITVSTVINGLVCTKQLQGNGWWIHLLKGYLADVALKTFSFFQQHNPFGITASTETIFPPFIKISHKQKCKSTSQGLQIKENQRYT